MSDAAASVRGGGPTLETDSLERRVFARQLGFHCHFHCRLHWDPARLR